MSWIPFIPLSLSILNIALSTANLFVINMFIKQYNKLADFQSMKCLMIICLGCLLESVFVTSSINNIISPKKVGIIHEILLCIYYVGKSLHLFGIYHYLFSLCKMSSILQVPSPLLCITPYKQKHAHWKLYYFIFIFLVIVIFALEEISNIFKDFRIVHGIANQIYNVWGIVFQIIGYCYFSKSITTKTKEVKMIQKLNQIIIVFGCCVVISTILFNMVYFFELSSEAMWYCMASLLSVINGFNVAIQFVIVRLSRRISQFVGSPAQADISAYS